MIKLAVTDQATGKLHVIETATHDAQKLYKALHEIFGDAQYQARPGELITVPDVYIPVNP